MPHTTVGPKVQHNEQVQSSVFPGLIGKWGVWCGVLQASKMIVIAVQWYRAKNLIPGRIPNLSNV